MIRPALQHYDLVLVNTPAQDYGVCIEQDQSGTIPPLGLGSILTFLAHHGKKVGLLDADALKMSVAETIDFLRSCPTDYVGFTAVSENIHIAGYIAQALPQRTILGGIHARLIPEETIQQFPFFLCRSAWRRGGVDSQNYRRDSSRGNYKCGICGW
ncbi:MAG: hypothetical protein CEN87_321 [Parcubacteria group bacterium Licking1014_1]|nr:MAG: hypothetical protein CEN87_321 [Parcubacteria group bacterium Licking1014_1]